MERQRRKERSIALTQTCLLRGESYRLPLMLLLVQARGPAEAIGVGYPL